MSPEGSHEPQAALPQSQEPDQVGPGPGVVESRALSPEKPLAAVVLQAEVTVDLETAQLLKREIAALVTRLTGASGDAAVSVVVRGEQDDVPLERKLNDLFADERVQAELQQRLNMPIEDALAALSVPHKRQAQTGNALMRNGLKTLRDVLVVGRRWVQPNVRGAGAVALSDLQDAIARQLPGLAWKDHPTMADIVGLCPDLASVNAAVIDADGSIQEILDWGESKIAQDWDPARSRARQARARAFAAEFRAEQIRQGLLEPTSAADDPIDH